jgi:hypothetical protein
MRTGRAPSSSAKMTHSFRAFICGVGTAESSAPVQRWRGCEIDHDGQRPRQFCPSTSRPLGVDAPLDARGFSSDSGNVVRRFRVSGLIVRQFTRRGPVWKSEDRVQIGVARSKRSE